MRITLSIDEQTVERVREVARQRGTSLNALVRAYLKLLTGQSSGTEILATFETIWKDPGWSGGKRLDREAIYEERASRSKPR